MPRYFFDIHDGQALRRDAVGIECQDAEAVRREAMQGLPEIALGTIPTDGDRQAFTVTVRNEANVTVYTATLTFAGWWMDDEPIPEPEDE